MRTFLACAIVAVLLVGGLAVLGKAEALTPRPGAYVDQVTFFQQGSQSQALLDMKQNNMDMYIFQLRKITDIQAAVKDPDLNVISTAGSLNDMLLNPVPTNQTKAPGHINAFSSREVREAMNYLIDRNYIVTQLFGGAAQAHTLLWWSQNPEYAREAVFMTSLEHKYAYNPDSARGLIASGMVTLGATLANGQWMYNGNQVNINLIQRTEDTRFDIGAYVADQLRSTGFKVTLIPSPSSKAFPIVYSGAPDTACSGCADGGPWGAYTEGFAATALTAWNDFDPKQFYNGGRAEAIWNFYKPGQFPVGTQERTLADLSDELYQGKYTSLAQRQQWVKQSVDLAIKNSVRVWMVAGAVFASSKRVTGYVYDLTGGPWSLYAERTARFGTIGGNLRVGQPIQFQSPWNVWNSGFDWLYDATQYRTFADPGVYVHPHTGLYIPIRADYQVTTAGPTGTLAVPADAVKWSNDVAPTGSFVSVGSGVAAKSKITYTYTFGSWHDGAPINMNDVLENIALWGRFEPSAANGGFFGAEGDIHKHDDDARSAGVILFNQLLRGVRVVNANTIEIYADYWHVDPSTIAGFFDVWPTIPWDVAELAMAPVLADQVKISSTTADNANVDALDLTKGTSIGYMDQALTAYKTTNHKAPGISTITDAEATARWAALAAFNSAHKHYFASNGPFYVDKVDTINLQTILKVDPNYPFMSDKWDSILTPRVPHTEIQTPPEIVPGLAATVNVKTSVAGAPYDKLSMSWFLTNPATGTVLFSGQAVKAGAGLWNVSLTTDQTGTLVPGAYNLQTLAVGDEAAIPVTATASIVAIPALAYFERALGTETSRLQGQLNDLNNKLTQAQTQATNAQNLANTLLIALAIAITVAIIAIAISAVSIRNTNRRFAQLAPLLPGAMPAQMEERRP